MKRDHPTFCAVVDELLYLLGYEEQPGEHTFHLCPICKVNATRRDKCAECLRREIEKEQRKAKS